jgi:glutathione S-transferase
VKLYYSPSSPFVRKVLVVASEVGLLDRIELLHSRTTLTYRDPDIVAGNALGQVPTFFDDEGAVLADSRVICEYLDSIGGGGLFPSGDRRWAVLMDQSSADGLLDAALLARIETVIRPEEKRWPDGEAGQMGKIRSVLDHFDARVEALAERVDIGTISLACALSYLDYRFEALDWRGRRSGLAKWYSRFAERPAMVATVLGIDRLATAKA